MFRIEVCFLLLVLVAVIVCENATSTSTSATSAAATTSSSATTTTTTTQKPDMIQDAFGKIMKIPEDAIGAFVDFTQSVVDMFKPK